MLDSPGAGALVAVSVLLASAAVLVPLAPLVARRSSAAALRRCGVSLTAAAVARADAVSVAVLDQHGTITTGDLRVVEIRPFDPDHDRSLRWFAGALAHSGDDRVARAVSRLAGAGRVADVEHLPGRGIAGRIDRHPVRVGTPDWIGIEAHHPVWTSLGVEVDHRPLGVLTVAEDLREQAAAGIARLRDLGLSVHLAAHGTEHQAAHLADAATIEPAAVHHEPAADLAARLAADGPVLLVGGSGFAPADAPGGGSGAGSGRGSGLWASTEAQADLVLTDLDVDRVADALTLARQIAARTRRGQWVAVAATVLGAGAAAAGLLTPLLAAGAGLLACALTATASST